MVSSVTVIHSNVAVRGVSESNTTKGQITMKKALLLIFAVPLFWAHLLHAVSYPPSEPSYLEDEDIMRVGAKLYMFHSGTDDVKRAIRINDVLTVVREYPPDISGVVKETGKVKVISALGDYYLEGQVIDGYAEPGSLAMKGTVGCLITTRLKKKP